MRIGQYEFKNRIFLAPMAGITDQPFRRLCSQLGAGLTFSEMMSTNPDVWHTEKSKLRLAHHQEIGINAVQIAGADPIEMAEAAKVNVGYGAEIIDINMGCPAKKVNKKMAGSALLREP
ncbi:tRNA-dihydrouridine synthase, partial [uncultured Haemophilus sp.]